MNHDLGPHFRIQEELSLTHDLWEGTPSLLCPPALWLYPICPIVVAGHPAIVSTSDLPGRLLLLAGVGLCLLVSYYTTGRTYGRRADNYGGSWTWYARWQARRHDQLIRVYEKEYPSASYPLSWFDTEIGLVDRLTPRIPTPSTSQMIGSSIGPLIAISLWVASNSSTNAPELLNGMWTCWCYFCVIAMTLPIALSGRRSRYRAVAMNLALVHRHRAQREAQDGISPDTGV